MKNYFNKGILEKLNELRSKLKDVISEKLPTLSNMNANSVQALKDNENKHIKKDSIKQTLDDNHFLDVPSYVLPDVEEKVGTRKEDVLTNTSSELETFIDNYNSAIDTIIARATEGIETITTIVGLIESPEEVIRYNTEISANKGDDNYSTYTRGIDDRQVVTTKINEAVDKLNVISKNIHGSEDYNDAEIKDRETILSAGLENGERKYELLKDVYGEGHNVTLANKVRVLEQDKSDILNNLKLYITALKNRIIDIDNAATDQERINAIKALESDLNKIKEILRNLITTENLFENGDLTNVTKASILDKANALSTDKLDRVINGFKGGKDELLGKMNNIIGIEEPSNPNNKYATDNAVVAILGETKGIKSKLDLENLISELDTLKEAKDARDGEIAGKLSNLNSTLDSKNSRLTTDVVNNLSGVVIPESAIGEDVTTESLEELERTLNDLKDILDTLKNELEAMKGDLQIFRENGESPNPEVVEKFTNLSTAIDNNLRDITTKLDKIAELKLEENVEMAEANEAKVHETRNNNTLSELNNIFVTHVSVDALSNLNEVKAKLEELNGIRNRIEDIRTRNFGTDSNLLALLADENTTNNKYYDVYAASRDKIKELVNDINAEVVKLTTKSDALVEEILQGLGNIIDGAPTLTTEEEVTRKKEEANTLIANVPSTSDTDRTNYKVVLDKHVATIKALDDRLEEIKNTPTPGSGNETSSGGDEESTGGSSTEDSNTESGSGETTEDGSGSGTNGGTETGEGGTSNSDTSTTEGESTDTDPSTDTPSGEDTSSSSEGGPNTDNAELVTRAKEYLSELGERFDRIVEPFVSSTDYIHIANGDKEFNKAFLLETFNNSDSTLDVIKAMITNLKFDSLTAIKEAANRITSSDNDYNSVAQNAEVKEIYDRLIKSINDLDPDGDLLSELEKIKERYEPTGDDSETNDSETSEAYDEETVNTYLRELESLKTNYINIINTLSNESNFDLDTIGREYIINTLTPTDKRELLEEFYGSYTSSHSGISAVNSTLDEYENNTNARLGEARNDERVKAKVREIKEILNRIDPTGDLSVELKKISDNHKKEDLRSDLDSMKRTIEKYYHQLAGSGNIPYDLDWTTELSTYTLNKDDIINSITGTESSVDITLSYIDTLYPKIDSSDVARKQGNLTVDEIKTLINDPKWDLVKEDPEFKETYDKIKAVIESIYGDGRLEAEINAKYLDALTREGITETNSLKANFVSMLKSFFEDSLYHDMIDSGNFGDQTNIGLTQWLSMYKKDSSDYNTLSNGMSKLIPHSGDSVFTILEKVNNIMNSEENTYNKVKTDQTISDNINFIINTMNVVDPDNTLKDTMNKDYLKLLFKSEVNNAYSGLSNRYESLLLKLTENNIDGYSTLDINSDDENNLLRYNEFLADLRDPKFKNIKDEISEIIFGANGNANPESIRLSLSSSTNSTLRPIIDNINGYELERETINTFNKVKKVLELLDPNETLKDDIANITYEDNSSTDLGGGTTGLGDDTESDRYNEAIIHYHSVISGIYSKLVETISEWPGYESDPIVSYKYPEDTNSEYNHMSGSHIYKQLKSAVDSNFGDAITDVRTVLNILFNKDDENMATIKESITDIENIRPQLSEETSAKYDKIKETLDGMNDDGDLKAKLTELANVEITVDNVNTYLNNYDGILSRMYVDLNLEFTDEIYNTNANFSNLVYDGDSPRLLNLDELLEHYNTLKTNSGTSGNYVEKNKEINEKITKVKNVLLPYNNENIESISEFVDKVKDRLDELNIRDNSIYTRISNTIEAINAERRIREKINEVINTVYASL